MICLRFLRFHARDFQRSWERSWEIFVLRLISRRHLVAVQLRNRMAGDLGMTRQIMRGQDRTHIARLVAGDRINLDLVATGTRQRHHGGAAQIVKRQSSDARPHG